jgi:hypothetical protein
VRAILHQKCGKLPIGKHSIKLVIASTYPHFAGMAELADAADSKSAGLRPLGVQLPLPAPSRQLYFQLAIQFYPALLNRSAVLCEHHPCKEDERKHE